MRTYATFDVEEDVHDSSALTSFLVSAVTAVKNLTGEVRIRDMSITPIEGRPGVVRVRYTWSIRTM